MYTIVNSGGCVYVAANPSYIHSSMVRQMMQTKPGIYQPIMNSLYMAWAQDSINLLMDVTVLTASFLERKALPCCELIA